MLSMKPISYKQESYVKAYIFKVVIEEDAFEDGRKAYHAFCPPLPLPITGSATLFQSEP